MNPWYIAILQGGLLGTWYAMWFVILADVLIRKEKCWIVRRIKNAGHKT